MKQAILITAYKNAKQLVNIVNYFSDSFQFYIHIDKKSKIDISEINRFKNVKIYSKYVVNWGGVNHVKAILLLASEAIKDESNFYFHLISGQDFPLKSVDFFEYELDKTKNYLSFVEIPKDRRLATGHALDVLDRIQYYKPYDTFNAKSNNLIIRLLVKIQRTLHVRRQIPDDFPKLFGGDTWWSLTKEALSYVIEYAKRDGHFLKRMKYTFCFEEIYFQTIIMNSQFSNNVINDCLRYIDWEAGSNGSPAFLTEHHFNKLISSNKIFARKFDETQSEKLRQLLVNYNNDK